MKQQSENDSSTLYKVRFMKEKHKLREEYFTECIKGPISLVVFLSVETIYVPPAKSFPRQSQHLNPSWISGRYTSTANLSDNDELTLVLVLS